MKLTTPSSRFVLIGVLFGVPMALVFIFMFGTSVGLIAGIFCGVLFGGAMYFVSGGIDRKFAETTQAIAAQRKIIVYGPATESGNGGMLYVTEEAVEFYPHAVNIKTAANVISKKDVIMVKAEGNGKLIVQNAQKRFCFVVNSATVWESECAKWLSAEADKVGE